MVSTARDLLYRRDPADEVERVISVPLPVDRVAPWTDRVIDGFYGKISVRETRGTGLPIVLIHGISSSKEAFARQMDGALGAKQRMIAIDLPGHGDSENAGDPSQGYTVCGYADAVVDVIERLGFGRFAMLGWSLGGHVALEIAASTPGVVGLMIVGTPPLGTPCQDVSMAQRPGPHALLAGQIVLSDSEMEFFAEAMGIDRDEALIAALKRSDGRARGRLFDDLLAGGASDETDIVANLSVPLAVVNGANDPIVDLNYIESVSYGSLWEEKVHTFPLAGHAPFLDAPDVFNAMLARFLRDVEQRVDRDAVTPGLCLGG